MKYKVGLDAGHGKDTFKRIGGKGVKYDNGKIFEEHTFNSAVVGYTKELLECNGIGVVLTQPLNANEVPLKARTDLANSLGVDLLVSFHADANSPNVKGHWVFHWHTSAKSRKLAQLWDKHANQLLDNPCRGVQESKPNHWTCFWMVKETNMPAILIEHAFMTNREDLDRLLSDEFRRKCAEVSARAICEYLGMPYKVEDIEPVEVVKPVESNDNVDKTEKANKVNSQIDYLYNLMSEQGGAGTWALNILNDVHDYMKSKKYL